MADHKMRRRRKGSDKPAEDDGTAENPETSSKSGRDRVLYILVFLGVAFGIYWSQQIIADLWEAWIGFSEWDTSHPDARRDGLPELGADVAKRDAVVEAFKHAWLAYERDAMGDDNYHPLSRKGSNLTAAGGIGYTIVDSLDTMLIMGLDEEYQRARFWVANNMSFDRDATFNTFETTIRVLGGLLSAYHLSGEDPIYLQRARELADRMLPAFDTPSGYPLTNINLGKRQGSGDPDLPGLVSTAEIATLQLEFRYLSHLTDDETYWRKVEQIMASINSARTSHGLASIFMDIDSGHFVPSAIRLGSRGDSFYEYLLKQHLQTNRREDVYRNMYDDVVDAIHEHLIQKSSTARLTYTSELVPQRHPGGEISWLRVPKQDHLVCFLGGLLLLGATTTGALVHPVSIPPRSAELTRTGLRDWKTGVELIKTCMKTHDTATGLSPEIVHFRIPSDNMDQMPVAPSDWYIKGARPGDYPPLDARYILRPETVESLSIAFRLTGDTQYRDQGWQIFQAIEKHCRVPSGGYASVVNVDELPARHEDRMETFMLSETLKYLYLLFADASVIPLDKYVFNTEAHPLPIFNASIRTGFS